MKPIQHFAIHPRHGRATRYCGLINEVFIVMTANRPSACTSHVMKVRKTHMEVFEKRIHNPCNPMLS